MFRFLAHPLVLLLLFTVHVSWLVRHWGGAAAQPLLAGWLYVPVFVAASVACLRASQRAAGRAGAAWRCLGLGVLAFGHGQALYTVLQAQWQRTPFPSAADALFLAFPVLAGSALLLFPRLPLRPAARIRLGLNLSVLWVCGATFSWHYLLAPLLLSAPERPLARVISLAYPVSDLCLLLITLLFLSRPHALGRAVGTLLAGGFGAFIVADIGYAVLSATDQYVPGSPLDLFWSLGGLALGLAATAARPAPAPLQPGGPPTDDDAPWIKWALVASVALTVSQLALTFALAHLRPEQRGLAVGGTLVLLLGTGRALHALRENSALNAALREAAQVLEGRVAQRTAELRALSITLEQRVTERTAELECSRAQLEFQARHDQLTGLANRHWFQILLQEAIQEAGARSGTLGLLYLDLDGFKLVNDTLGHGAGDALLRAVAGRVQAALGPGSALARFGGDEFVALVRDLPGDAALAAVAGRVAAAVAAETPLGGQRIHVSASIGAAQFPRDGADADDLIQQADAALYRAKHGGKSGICFVTPAISGAAQLRGRLAEELRGALPRGEFRVVYQPQVVAASGALASFEALLRWTSPTLGSISPGDFIPVAEETGQIADIGAWVLGEVLRQQRAWRDAGLSVVPVAVNVAPGQFARADFVPELEGRLARSGLDGHLLELELTEGALVRDLGAIALTMHSIHALGVKLAIDDFGGGRTALGDLLQLPVHTVKLDRSLLHMHSAGEQGGRTGILPAVVTLAHALKLAVVAEGVETAEQWRLVADSGCDRVQGYLTGRPEPAQEAARRLRQSERGAVTWGQSGAVTGGAPHCSS